MQGGVGDDRGNLLDLTDRRTVFVRRFGLGGDTPHRGACTGDHALSHRDNFLAEIGVGCRGRDPARWTGRRELVEHRRVEVGIVSGRSRRLDFGPGAVEVSGTFQDAALTDNAVVYGYFGGRKQ